MILFMTKTWFLWWIFAVVVIVRWFHVLSTDAAIEPLDKPAGKGKENTVVRERLAV